MLPRKTERVTSIELQWAELEQLLSELIRAEELLSEVTKPADCNRKTKQADSLLKADCNRLSGNPNLNCSGSNVSNRKLTPPSPLNFLHKSTIFNLVGF